MVSKLRKAPRPTTPAPASQWRQGVLGQPRFAPKPHRTTAPIVARGAGAARSLRSFVFMFGPRGGGCPALRPEGVWGEFTVRAPTETAKVHCRGPTMCSWENPSGASRSNVVGIRSMLWPAESGDRDVSLSSARVGLSTFLRTQILLNPPSEPIPNGRSACPMSFGRPPECICWDYLRAFDVISPLYCGDGRGAGDLRPDGLRKGERT